MRIPDDPWSFHMYVKAYIQINAQKECFILYLLLNVMELIQKLCVIQIHVKHLLQD